MKLAVAFAVLFVGAFAAKDYPVPYPPQDGKDGQIAYVPDINGGLQEVDADAEAEEDYPYFPIATAVRFELYTPDNIEVPQLLSPNNDSLLQTNYDPNRPTRMFIHGWNARGGLTPLFIDAYFKKASHNVNLIAVNWRDGADTVNYPGARRRVNRVGPYVAQFIDFLVNRGNLVLKDFVLVGHSLGAHVAGIAGKNVVTGRVGTIVGLDPASPLFSYRAADARLARTDAEYVETIHTNAGTLGFTQPLGHASFYPNGGSRQPGCGWDMVGNCAHGRAYFYYTESIYAPTKYLGVRCESLRELQRGRCRVTDESVFTQMGGPNPNNRTRGNGIYFFETNSKPLFSIGSQIVNGRRMNAF